MDRRQRTSRLLLPGAAAIIAHYLVAELGGLYLSWRGVSGNREAFSVLTTWLVSFIVLSSLAFATGRLNGFSRIMLGLWLLGTGLLLVLTHSLLRGGQRSLWLRGLNTKGCAIVGVTELGIQLARNLMEEPELGLRLAGYYDDRPSDRSPSLPPGVKQRIGNIEDLVGDARAGVITRLGAVLRRTSIDELLPGITGLAQVRGWRCETDTLEKMERRVECDHEYIREWSLWLDVKILFRTIFVVLARKNAY